MPFDLDREKLDLIRTKGFFGAGIEPNKVNIVNVLRPRFHQYKELWKFYLDSYTGGQAYRDGGYLLKHLNNESREDFERRKELSFYENYPKDTIDSYATKLFSKPVQRLDTFNENLVFFHDIQNRVVNIDMYWKYMFTFMLVFGEIYFFIDHPIVTPGREISDEDRLNNDIRFVFQIMFPFYVRHVVFDFNGEIKEILVESNDRFKLWTGSTVDIWEKRRTAGNEFQVNYVDQYIHDFKHVPALRYSIDLNQDGVGDSFIADTSTISKIIYNIDSIPTFDLLTNANTKWMLPVTHDIIQFYTEVGMLDENTGEWSFDKVKYILTSDQGDVKNITKNLDYHKNLFEWRDKLERVIQKRTARKIQKLFQESGISKAYDQSDVNLSLEMFASIAESNEKRAWELFSKVIGQPKNIDDIQVRYNKHFDIIDKNKQLENLVSIKRETTNDIQSAMVEKVWATDFLKPNLQKEDFELLIDSIDKEIEGSKNVNDTDNEDIVDVEDQDVIEKEGLERLE